MDLNQIFIKTQIGDEAVRQSTRVVQRNLRMVLVQVDGNLNVAELSAKIGNPRLVEAALRELQEGGFIVPRQGSVLGRTSQEVSPPGNVRTQMPLSQFSTFGERPRITPPSSFPHSQFSSFGKPILPAAGFQNGGASTASDKKRERKSRPEDVVDEVRPFAVGRKLLGVLFGFLLLAFLLAVFFPFNLFKSDLEVAASRLLQTPVRIRAVSSSFWPRPALVLSDVKLGEGAEEEIAQLRITSPFSLLGSGVRTLPHVEVIGASVSADFLVSSALFKSPLPAVQGKLRIHQLNLEKLSVRVNDLMLRDFSGQMVFASDGSMEKADLRSDDLGLRLHVMPSAEGLFLDIQGNGWKPLTTLSFDSLQAKGLLQKGKLMIKDLDASVLNGILKGNWLLDWSKEGLSMVGEASLLRLDCRKVTAIFAPSLRLEGELSGNLRLRASGGDWQGLWANVEATLDSDISRGVLHGIDIGEAVRGGIVMRSGSTRFDRLRAVLDINPRQVIGRDIQMTAGMMSVVGQFSAGRQRPVDANLLVTMQTSVAKVRAPVHVSGDLSNLMAVSGK